MASYNLIFKERRFVCFPLSFTEALLQYFPCVTFGHSFLSFSTVNVGYIDKDLSVSLGNRFQKPPEFKSFMCSVLYTCVFYTHPSVDFKLSVDYL